MKGGWIKCVIIVVASFSSSWGSEVSETRAVPVVQYQDFTYNARKTISLLQDSLKSDGIIAVQGIPNLNVVRQGMIGSAVNCVTELQKDGVQSELLQHYFSTLLEDGTERSSFGFHYKPDGFEEETNDVFRSYETCSVFLSNYLQVKSIIFQLSQAFAKRLDDVCDTRRFTQFHPIQARSLEGHYNPNPTFSSASELYSAGSQLHHTHVYRSLSSQEVRSQTKALDFHADHGLFLSFIPGIKYSETKFQDPTSNHEFLVRSSSDGSVYAPVFPDDGNVVVFMLGDAVKKLLNPICAIELNPTVHAVDLSQSEIRGWFGAMVLPPVDVTLFSDKSSNTKLRLDSNKQTFGDVLLTETQEGENQSHGLTLGCSQDLHLKELAKGGCKKGTQFCWMQCMPLTPTLNPDQCAAEDNPSKPWEKHSLECVSSDGKLYKGGMCTDCSLKCMVKREDSSGEGGLMGHDKTFCSGLPSVMFMNGFSFDFTKRPDDACIVFLFSGLAADNAFKYFFVVLLSFLLGISVEYIVFIRRTFQKTGSCIFFSKPKNKASLRVKFIILYSIQIILGYAAMLVAMTYSTILFVAVISGLCFGHLRFNYKAPVISGEICCQFMEEVETEADETENRVAQRKFEMEEMQMEKAHLLRKRGKNARTGEELDPFLDDSETNESSALLS